MGLACRHIRHAPCLGVCLCECEDTDAISWITIVSTADGLAMVLATDIAP